MAESVKSSQAFTIFRAKDALGLMESECMSIEAFSPVQREGMNKVLEAGYQQGDEVKVLCNIPGFSLIKVWFKKDYPLPLHSHDADCLYYIIAGSVRLGSEELGSGDSFFIPADMPYTYKPGQDGVELLEIRQAAHFNFLNLAKGEAFWNRAAETVSASRAEWTTAERPKLNA